MFQRYARGHVHGGICILWWLRHALNRCLEHQCIDKCARYDRCLFTLGLLGAHALVNELCVYSALGDEGARFLLVDVAGERRYYGHEVNRGVVRFFPIF